MNNRSFYHRHRAASLLCLALALASPATALAQGTAQEEAFRAYLLAHPEVIVESLERYRAQQMDQQTQQEKQAIATLLKSVRNNPDFPVAGTAGGIPVVEFFDYQCGYCKRMLPQVAALADSKSGVEMIFVEFPILGPASVVAARAALAAQRQGRYMDFHTALMNRRGQLDESAILETARSLGLDMARLARDMADPAQNARIAANMHLAGSLEIQGTPAFIIGDRLIRGALPADQMTALLDAARAAR